MIVIMTSRLNKSMNKPNTTDTYISYLLESNTNIIFWLHLGINLKKYCPKEIQREKKNPTLILVIEISTYSCLTKNWCYLPQLKAASTLHRPTIHYIHMHAFTQTRSLCMNACMCMDTQTHNGDMETLNFSFLGKQLNKCKWLLVLDEKLKLLQWLKLKHQY